MYPQNLECILFSMYKEVYKTGTKYILEAESVIKKASMRRKPGIANIKNESVVSEKGCCELENHWISFTALRSDGTQRNYNISTSPICLCHRNWQNERGNNAV